MADESPQPATPASKGKAAKNEMVTLRLMSAGATDEFRIGDDVVITHQGIDVPIDVADELLELGAHSGVQLAYSPVEDKE